MEVEGGVITMRWRWRLECL